MDATGERGFPGNRSRQTGTDDDPAHISRSEVDDLAEDEPEDGLGYRGFGPDVVPGGRRVRLVGGDTTGNSGP